MGVEGVGADGVDGVMRTGEAITNMRKLPFKIVSDRESAVDRNVRKPRVSRQSGGNSGARRQIRILETIRGRHRRKGASLLAHRVGGAITAYIYWMVELFLTFTEIRESGFVNR